MKYNITKTVYHKYSTEIDAESKEEAITKACNLSTDNWGIKHVGEPQYRIDGNRVIFVDGVIAIRDDDKSSITYIFRLNGKRYHVTDMSAGKRCWTCHVSNKEASQLSFVGRYIADRVEDVIKTIIKDTLNDFINNGSVDQKCRYFFHTTMDKPFDTLEFIGFEYDKELEKIEITSNYGLHIKIPLNSIKRVEVIEMN